MIANLFLRLIKAHPREYMHVILTRLGDAQVSALCNSKPQEVWLDADAVVTCPACLAKLEELEQESVL